MKNKKNPACQAKAELMQEMSFRYKYLLRQVQSIQTNAEFTPQIRDLHQPRYQSSH